MDDHLPVFCLKFPCLCLTFVYPNLERYCRSFVFAKIYILVEVHSFLVKLSPSCTCFSREQSSCSAQLFSMGFSLTEFTCMFQGRNTWYWLLYIIPQGLRSRCWDDTLLSSDWLLGLLSRHCIGYGTPLTTTTLSIGLALSPSCVIVLWWKCRHTLHSCEMV